MPTYRIVYKSYYREHSEFGHADVIGKDELAALRKFFREIRSDLRDADLLEGAELPEVKALDVKGEYKWWAGDWYHAYRGIEEIHVLACPTCGGTGEIAAASAAP